MTMARQQTRFDLCDAHAHLVSRGRRWLAETFCEGGPGSGPPCAPAPCRISPGTDFFNADVTDELGVDWVRNWAVNANGDNLAR